MSIGSFIRLVLASLLALTAITPASAQDERRLALVIGVDDYGFAPLKNPVNDARAVAASLERINFTVTRLDNPTKGQIRLAVDKLYAEARNGSKNATLFVYFAGHGIQIGQENYLIPAKAELQGRSLTYADFDDQAIHAQWLLRKLSETGVTRLIFALDACRDNPLAQAGDLAAGPGLAKMSPLAGGPDTLILFATQPGDTASDGAYSNSPFSGALASTLAVPGQSTQDLIYVIGEKVRLQTGQRQKPYFEGSLLHMFVKNDAPVSGGRRAGGVGSAGTPLVEQTRVDGAESGVALTNELLRTRTLADLERQSTDGDGFASFAVGMAHWEGLGGATKDIKTAARFMQRAVSQGSSRAANALGLFYCCDNQFQRDPDTAIGWFEIGAKGDSVFAMRNLGLELTKGDTPRDLKGGLAWLDQAAQKGSTDALADMADIHAVKSSPVHDPFKARMLYVQSYEAGNSYAALSLGNAHQWGISIAEGKIDLDQAMSYYLDGGAAGCSTCWAAAAALLNNPQYTERYDPEGALALYKTGSEAGDLDARVEYGNLLRMGAGSIAPDLVGAFQAYQSAAAAGSLEGRRAAAFALAKGRGPARDIEKAAPEIRDLLQYDRHEDLNKRHAIYEPNYWGLAWDLILGLRSGELQEAYPGETSALVARYGAPDGGLKPFTVEIDCAGIKAPFQIYIVNWDRPNDESIEGQVSWLKHMRGCDVPADVVARFRAIRRSAREQGVKFTDLAVQEFGTVGK